MAKSNYLINPAIIAERDFIADFLRIGYRPSVIFKKFSEKFPKIKRHTFNNRLNAAKKLVNSENELIRKTSEKRLTLEVEKNQNKIISSVDRQIFLTNIINGNPIEVKQLLPNGKIAQGTIIPSLQDRLKALSELNKMDGSYSAVKIAMPGENKLIIEKTIIESRQEFTEQNKKPDDNNQNQV